MIVQDERLSIATVLDAAGQALKEIAESALDLGCEGPLSSEIDSSASRMGAYVSLTSDVWSAEVGIASDSDGCLALSRALMMMGDDDLEPLPVEDIADAVGEITNLVAGGVKNRLHKLFGDVQLGTPLVIKGHIETLERQQLSASVFQVGSSTVDVTVLLTN